MIRRFGWLCIVGFLGVIACAVLAQGPDEDGLIVSEEMLLEDAVNGDLGLDDAELDLDALMADLPLEDELDAPEEKGVGDAPASVSVDAVAAAETAAVSEVAGVLEDDSVDDLSDLLGSMDDAPAADVAMDDPVADEPADDLMDLLDMAADEPVDAPAADVAMDEPVADEPADDLMDLLDMAADEPVDTPAADVAMDEPFADEPADDLLDLLDEPADEPVDAPAADVAMDAPVADEPADDLLDLLDEPADEPVADVAMDEPVADEPADDLLDLLDEPADEPVDAPAADVAMDAPVADEPADALLGLLDGDGGDSDDLLGLLMDEPGADEPVEDVAPAVDASLAMDAALDAAVEDPVEPDEPSGGDPMAMPVPPQPQPRVVTAPSAAADDSLEAELQNLREQEALRRRALEAHGLDMLAQAEQALDSRDYGKAERLFSQALELIPERADMEMQRERLRAGIARNYYEWALSMQRRQNLEGAKDMAGRALSYRHPKALDLIEELESPPPPPVVPKIERRRDEPDYIAKQAQIRQWLEEGRELIAAREYDAAQLKFETVLQPEHDPQNTEAIRMIHRIARLRYDRASMEAESTRRNMITDVRQTWNPRDYGLNDLGQKMADETVKPGPGPDLRGAREVIRRKMEAIKIPEIDFRQANINDVIDFLQEASVEHDETPETGDGQRGINIILNIGQSEQSAPTRAAPPSDDPFADMLGDTGGGATKGSGGAGGVPLITFSARYITLGEALKIVTQVANLKYRVEGSVVMIVPLNAAEGEIVVRMYDVLPAVEEKIMTVGSEMEASRNRGGTGDFIAMEATGVGVAGGDWQQFFDDMGVEWPEGSSIRYVRTIGKIVVANTERNLATFERILEVLNVVPSQIEIEARFVEVTQSDMDSLGFEWILTDDWKVAEKRGQGNLPASARQRLEIKEGTVTVGNRFIPEGLPEVAANVTDNMLTFASVLTNPELSMVLHALQRRGHADLLSAPKVTTKSGTEATIKVVTEYIYPTEYELQSIGNLGGGGGQNNTFTLPEGVPPFAAQPSSFETREVGVILSVLPEVSPEGQMINLNLTPEVVSEPIWFDYGLSFGDTTIPMQMPFFHSRSISTSISIYNGATVVMGGMITENRTDVDDKVPILGDIPLLGRLFRSKYEYSEKRNLLVFVTARLVDPRGMPLKTDKQKDIPGELIQEVVTADN